MRKQPTFLLRVKSAWAILTGRAWLYLEVNGLEARWLVEPAGGIMLHLRLDIRLNKVTYTIERTIACGERNPESRADIIDQVQDEMVHDITRRVLLGRTS